MEHPGHYLTAYALGNLSEEGRRDVETHVAGCQACAVELRTLQASAGSLGEAFADRGVPRELERRRMELVLVPTVVPARVPKWMIGVSVTSLALIALVGTMTFSASRDSSPAMSRKSSASMEQDESGGGLIGRFGGRPGMAPQEESMDPGLSSIPYASSPERPADRPAHDKQKEDDRAARVDGPEEPGVETNDEKNLVEDHESASRRERIVDDVAGGKATLGALVDPSADRAGALRKKTAARVPSGGDRGLAGYDITPGQPLVDDATAALEPRRRAFAYYRTLDPSLDWRRFESSDLAVPAPAMNDEGLGRDEFKKRYGCDPFFDTSVDRLSTFGMDVDTASFTRSRALLANGQLPEPAQVRVEEFVNYFGDDAPADPERVFSMSAEAGDAPFGGPGLDLVKITLEARELRPGEKKKAILTIAIDTSGSMFREDRLELVRQSLRSLVAALAPEDRVGLVAYSSHAYLVLPHTPARESSRILAAIDSLAAHGESHVEAGLEMAYHLADEIFEPRAVNRVILCSDGVATAGARGPEEILEKVKVYSSRGIYLSTIGFGRTKYDDHLMESLADRGNGRYDYVGSAEEAARFFSGSLPSNLEVLARDAKIQVVFNPEVVSHYRLLGYENRDIADEKFRDDTVDAGEVGPGTSVTALYEVRRHPRSHGELGRVHVRYHSTVTSQVEELEFPLSPGIRKGQATSDRFRVLAAAAETAELLRGSYWARNGSFRSVVSYLQAMGPEARGSYAWQEIADVAVHAQLETIRQLSAGK